MAKHQTQYTFTDPYGRSTTLNTPLGTTKDQATEAYMASDLFLKAQQPPEKKNVKTWIDAARKEAGYIPEQETWSDKIRGSIRGTAVAGQFVIDLVQAVAGLPFGANPYKAFEDGMFEGFVKKTVPAPKGMGGKKLEKYFEFLPISVWGAFKIAGHAGKVAIKAGEKHLGLEGVKFLRGVDDIEDVAKETSEAVQKGYKEMIETVKAEKAKLAAELGNTRVTMGQRVFDAIDEQVKHDKNLMKKAGIQEALETFKKEGSIRSMWELEKALKAKIPDVITTPQAKHYVQIKIALKEEYKIIEQLSIDQTKLIQQLEIAFKEAGLTTNVGAKEAAKLKTYREQTSAMLSMFKDRPLIKQLAQGKFQNVEEEIVTRMTSGGKNKWGNIKVVMDALETQGARGNKIQRNLGLVYWKQQFEDIILKGSMKAQKDPRVYLEMADQMLNKIYAFGPKRMKELMRHAPDYNDMKELTRVLEAVARKGDPGFALRQWRKVFVPGTWKAKFPERLMMGVAIGAAYKGLNAGHGGQAQGNR